MISIFDFSKMYSGLIVIDEETFPCTLSFPDAKIHFKLIGNPDKQYLNKFDFAGSISTEQGIMNYSALSALQTSWSSGSHGMSQQAFQADGLLLAALNATTKPELFEQASFLYTNLHKISRFIETEEYDTEKLKFGFKRIFESLELIQNSEGQLSLENPVRHNLSVFELQQFTLTIDPFISLESAAGLSLSDAQHFSDRLGWFFQLLFDLRQQPTDLVLFEKALQTGSADRQAPYYYLAPELIRRKAYPLPHTRHPSLELDELSEHLAACYGHWDSMNPAQRKLSNLYFNEINSVEYYSDDRFKNLCAIVQGLEVLRTNTKVHQISGEMNAKLRRASVQGFETITCKFIRIPVLHKLYELIGDQRDHYQHLNKPLKYDLSLDTELFVSINILLASLIRYHFLCFVTLPEDKCSRLIAAQLSWITTQLASLEHVVSSRYQLK